MGNPEETDANGEPRIWQDPRFSHLVSDPRFKQLPQSKRKVKIDKRFESMFSDAKFKVKYTVDKYGRKLNKTSSEDLKKYYEIEETSSDDEEAEDEERKKEEIEITKGSDEGEDDLDENDELIGSDSDEIVPETLKEKLLNSKVDYARGEGRLLTDSSSDDESSEDEVDDELFIDHVWGELDNEAETTEESTRRLAACNMDWDRIRAADIMILCSSFLPPGGSIESVTIYPSQFGKERLADEEVNGPTELTASSKRNAVARDVGEEDDEDDSDSDDELVGDDDSDIAEGEDYHMEKLRQYQLNRLKYYYAVIQCDSVATADKIYKECDGIEYESSATKLDFRFIPDETTFDEDEPRDVCTELPDLHKYKPRLFTTTALQQAKVELTWDETSVERKELGDKISAGKLDDITDADMKKYVACSSDDDESAEDEVAVEQPAAVIEPENPVASKKKDSDQINKYKSLLEEINKKEEDKSKSKFEMEYTWGLNMDSKSKDKREKALNAPKPELTPIEKALQKRSEKNKRRKEERKKKRKGINSQSEGSNDEENDADDDDVPDGIDLNDPYFADEFANGDFEAPKSKSKKGKKSKKKSTNDETDEEEKEANELELLMDDGDDNEKHFSLDKIMKSENETKSKKKRKTMLKKSKKEIGAAKQEVEDNFEVDIADQRFKSIYTSHLYSIDPTNPNFKKTKGMDKIIHEKLKRRHGDEEKPTTVNMDADESAAVKRPKKRIEDSILVKNLKRKIQGKKLS